MLKQRPAKFFNQSSQVLPLFLFNRLMEGLFIFVIFISLYIILALATYSTTDPSWMHVNSHSKNVVNSGGQIGAYLADALFWLCGYFAYVIPLGVSYLASFIVQESKMPHFNQSALILRLTGFFLLMLGFSAFLGLKIEWIGPDGRPGAGGMLGAVLADGLSYAFNVQGALLLVLAVMLVGITWLTDFSWIRMIENVGQYTLQLISKIFNQVSFIYHALKRTLRSFILPTYLKFTKLNQAKEVNIVRPRKPMLSTNKLPNNFIKEADTPSNESIIKPPITQAVAKLENFRKDVSTSLPSLDLLYNKDTQQVKSSGFSAEALEQYSREVEQHLLDFGIHVDVVAVHPGPVITRFELQLAAGVKVSRLSALVKDLARALSVTSVRIVEIIPGKTVVGLELPNQHREIVRLKEVLQSDVFQQAHSPLTLALGVDIAGYPMIVDLAKMPHLLVAGTTGSGKSVGINAMILSILYRANPSQVRLIMIDPKMLELSVYDGIPHLLTPVVTDMKEAANALRWCVAEMDRRYRLLASVGVRNLAGFNNKVLEAEAENNPLLDPFEPTLPAGEKKYLHTLPYVVVIIDELADMMMVVGKKVEQLIARIAQKARAA